MPPLIVWALGTLGAIVAGRWIALAGVSRLLRQLDHLGHRPRDVAGRSVGE